MPDTKIPRRNTGLLRPENAVAPVYIPAPWERQFKETHYAFSMFKLFLGLPERGKRRTVAEAERAVGRTPGSLGGLSVRNRWDERARAWDAEVSRIESRAKLSEIEKMTRRHARIGEKMTDLGEVAVEALLTAAQEDPMLLSPSDAVKVVQAGIAIERKSAGLDGGGGVGERQITIKIVEESESPPEGEVLDGDFVVLSDGGN